MVTLTLADELALLALRPDGRPRVQPLPLECGFAGAILAELAMAGKIDLTDKRLVVTDPTPGGHPGIDGVLGGIAAEPKARKPEWWVNKLRSKDLRLAVFDGLVQQGLITDDTTKALGMFPIRNYPEADGGPKKVVSELVGTALSGGAYADRTAVLIALAQGTGVLRKAFPGVDRKLVKEIVNNNWAGRAVKAVLDSIASATAAAVVATTAAS